MGHSCEDHKCETCQNSMSSDSCRECMLGEKLTQEHENFLKVHRENMQLAARNTELRMALEEAKCCIVNLGMEILNANIESTTLIKHEGIGARINKALQSSGENRVMETKPVPIKGVEDKSWVCGKHGHAMIEFCECKMAVLRDVRKIILDVDKDLNPGEWRRQAITIALAKLDEILGGGM